jgi:hypothetical protein
MLRTLVKTGVVIYGGVSAEVEAPGFRWKHRSRLAGPVTRYSPNAGLQARCMLFEVIGGTQYNLLPQKFGPFS